MVKRDEKGILRFDDIAFTEMLGEMIAECNSTRETFHLIEDIRDCVENFCEEVEKDLEDYK